MMGRSIIIMKESCQIYQMVFIKSMFILRLVWTRGAGPMRVITGGSKMWFTPDHYGTMIQIKFLKKVRYKYVNI